MRHTYTELFLVFSSLDDLKEKKIVESERRSTETPLWETRFGTAYGLVAREII